MLYLQPVQNNPNLNSDLYQCSLLGTNNIRLASEVSDYYPQDGGIVVIKRRTSRSGHDLLYVKADKPGKENLLYRGMDFGAVSFNVDNNRWAGFVRLRLALDWNVVVARVGEDKSKAIVLPMPEGTRPGAIAWSGDNLMVMVDKDDTKPVFEISPNNEKPVWKPINSFYFPGYDRFVLNKSESLSIDQIEENGKPCVEIARVWFTGDRNR
jgi:hypothetical protein